ncbi:hypothetical protein R50076_31620 [Gilvimarinus japonicus]
MRNRLNICASAAHLPCYTGALLGGILLALSQRQNCVTAYGGAHRKRTGCAFKVSTINDRSPAGYYKLEALDV